MSKRRRRIARESTRGWGQTEIRIEPVSDGRFIARMYDIDDGEYRGEVYGSSEDDAFEEAKSFLGGALTQRPAPGPRRLRMARADLGKMFGPERRKIVEQVVLKAVQEDKNPFAAAWDSVQADRHMVSDALFALQRSGLITHSPEYGYRAVAKENPVSTGAAVAIAVAATAVVGIGIYYFTRPAAAAAAPAPTTPPGQNDIPNPLVMTAAEQTACTTCGSGMTSAEALPPAIGVACTVCAAAKTRTIPGWTYPQPFNPGGGAPVSQGGTIQQQAAQQQLQTAPIIQIHTAPWQLLDTTHAVTLSPGTTYRISALADFNLVNVQSALASLSPSYVSTPDATWDQTDVTDPANRVRFLVTVPTLGTMVTLPIISGLRVWQKN